MDPPEKAIVLSVDEKSQIQALDRTQPLLPMRPGQPERRTHDYKRHGTTTLFAALDVATGEVTGGRYRQHRQEEFLDFLKLLAKTYPKPQLHLVLDNYRTHKHPEVVDWLSKHRRFHFHFTPTSATSSPGTSLSGGRNLGPSYFLDRKSDAQRNRLARQLERLGFDVNLTPGGRGHELTA